MIGARCADMYLLQHEPCWLPVQVYGGKESKYMEFLEPKLLTMGPVLDVETGVQGEEPRGEDHGRGSCGIRASL